MDDSDEVSIEYDEDDLEQDEDEVEVDVDVQTSLLSYVVPEGYQSSTCGYCSPSGQRSASRSSHSVGITAVRLTCDTYQHMIDRGWRRSGDYCYKRDMKRTCCPQYTIKLDALAFAPSRSQRKVVHRWNRYVLHGEDNDPDIMMEDQPANKKSKKPPPFSLIESVHASEASACDSNITPKHEFEVVLEPSSFTDEKFQLYCNYQKNIHNDYRNSEQGFIGFLVKSPLHPAPIPYTNTPPSHLPECYQSYHQLYRLDGELIAMAVLDILPNCVSSVYFMYDKRWEAYSLGKLSALREASLAREMHNHGAPTQCLYMGYYIHSCQKMRYKGEYSPSHLLDPEEYTWYPLKICIPLLESNRYACFSHPERSLEGPDIPPQPPIPDLPLGDLSRILVFERRFDGLQSFTESSWWRDSYCRDILLRAIEGLGMELSRRIIFLFT